MAEQRTIDAERIEELERRADDRADKLLDDVRLLARWALAAGADPVLLRYVENETREIVRQEANAHGR